MSCKLEERAKKSKDNKKITEKQFGKETETEKKNG